MRMAEIRKYGGWTKGNKLLSFVQPTTEVYGRLHQICLNQLIEGFIGFRGCATNESTLVYGWIVDQSTDRLSKRQVPPDRLLDGWYAHGPWLGPQ